jgi:hypothetical protein
MRRDRPLPITALQPALSRESFAFMHEVMHDMSGISAAQNWTVSRLHALFRVL